MPSDFLTPFLELDEEFCKQGFRGLEVTDGPSAGPQHHQHHQQQTQAQRVSGFQRRHSLCPVTLPNSKFNAGSCEEGGGTVDWGLDAAPPHHWSRDRQPLRSTLNHIPFRVDRSVSMIEGGHGGGGGGLRGAEDRPVLLPPPGLSLSSSASLSLSSSSASSSPSSGPLAPSSPPITTRYKTELCRTFEESGTCKYGAKCQFAHGLDEVRGLSRHPKYKTEPCRTFHTVGFCPYGARCHFVHNAEEGLAAAAAYAAAGGGVRSGGGGVGAQRPPLLRQSISFSGFSSRFHPVQELAAAAPSSSSSSLLFLRASSVSPPPPSSSEGSPELLSPLLFPEPGVSKHCPYPFSGVVPDHLAAAGDAHLRFYAVCDSSSKTSSSSSSALLLSSSSSSTTPRLLLPPQREGLSLLLPGLQRCSSADSLSEEGYTSSCSLSSSSGSESPSFEGRRLPIFSRLSVSDE